ncbi:APC family permease [Nocardioides ultimimeridianus]
MTDTPAPSLKRSLGIRDGIAIAASSTAATTSIGIGMGVLATYAGRQVPIVLILAFLPILGIAGAYARLNRSEPNCGSGYTWVGRSLSPWLGFLSGWVVVLATIIFMAYTGTITGSVVLQFVNRLGLHTLLGITLDPLSTGVSTVVGLTVLLAVTITAITGVRSATRLQLWLLVFEYAVLVVFLTMALLRGHHGISLSWFDPFAIAPKDLAMSLVLAVFIYWGWDAAFSVNEESKDPQDAARGGMIALFAMLGLFVYAAVAFQRLLSTEELAGYGDQGLSYLGVRLAGEPWASLPLMALMFSAVASLQSSVIPTARGLLAMGRDRTLGPVWTRIHPRFGTPAVGTALLMTAAAAIAVVALGIPRINDLILTAVNSVGLIVAFYYGLTAFACAARFRHTRGTELVQAVVVPAVSGAVLWGLGGYLGYLYATMSDHFAASPDNGWFMLAVPGAIVGTGLLAAAWARYGRRSAYFHHGRGTDADSLVLPMDLDPVPTTPGA